QPLREMVADPLLSGEVPPGNELSEALQVAPNFAAAVLKLYGAYREIQKRLTDAARGLPSSAPEVGVDAWLTNRSNEDIEGLAEDIWSELSPKDDIFSGLKARLRSGFGTDTRILPTTILGADRSRYDRHAQRLLISEALSFEARIEEAAHLVARLEGKALIEAATQTTSFANRPEQLRAAKAALFDRLCLTLLTPRGKFNAAAEDLKMDVSALARRFSITQGKAMLRLATLRDEISAIAVDRTGRLCKHVGKLPFHLAKDEPLCGQLPLFDEGPGIHIAALKPTEGSGFIAIAVHGHLLFISAAMFEKTVYTTKTVQRPMGATCRLCELRNCEKRSAASAIRPAGLNDYMRGATDFEPV
ncbi:MAG: hypothetical protein ABJA10_00755, partial [Aestuariivirga sp.]